MTGIFLEPDNDQGRHRHVSNRFGLMYDQLASLLGWAHYIAGTQEDGATLWDDLPEAVFAHSVPHHTDWATFAELASLPDEHKLILYAGDVHSQKQAYREMARRMFARADLIITASRETFRRCWPEFQGKAFWIPNWYINYSGVTDADILKDAAPKCVVSGAEGGCYPLRYKAFHSTSECFVKLAHPGYGLTQQERAGRGAVMGKEYVAFLRQHFAALCTCSTMKYLVAKVPEAMAAGALVLSDGCTDMEAIGLQAGVHYVRLTYADIPLRIEYACKHRDEFEGIRAAGCAFVREHLNEEVTRNRFLEAIKTVTGDS